MNEDKTLQDILEIVQFLKDHAVTCDEFQNFHHEFSGFRAEVKEEFKNSRGEIVSHVDHFIGLHTKLDTELTALRAKYDRLEEKLEKVVKYLQLEGV